jgi:hypothetical protein
LGRINAGSPAERQQANDRFVSCRQLGGVVVVYDGRVTIRAINQPLSLLLRAIASCVKPLATHIAPELENEAVTLACADVPIEEGLRRIVHAYDAFFYYAGAATSPALEGLWVFPRGNGRALAPLDAIAWASDADVEKRLASSDADVRFRALKALIDRRGEGAMDHVLAALADPDDVMRAQVLDLALSSGFRLPPDRWAAIALSDPSALIRLQALQSAPDGPELASVAETAQNDPDEYVQLEAREILARLAAERANRQRVP